MYSDLHCHPTGRNFPYFSDFARSINSKEAHPWVILASGRGNLREGKRATNYDQSDFARLIEGNVKLVFAALYPFEHGFFNQIRDTPLGNGTKYSDYYDHAGSAPGLSVVVITGVSQSRLDYIRGNDYQYWKELVLEYDFICRKSGIPQTAKILVDKDENPNRIKPRKKDVTGTYYLLAENPNASKPTAFSDKNRSFKTKQQVNFNNKNETYVILTIEGMHALSMKNQAIREQRNVLLSRIESIKKWDPPIFFMTFAHHFDNNLCAHAHSLFRIEFLKSWNPDQSRNMNYWESRKDKPTPTHQVQLQGFSDLGMLAVFELLNIQKKGNKLVPKPNNGRRILIDTKHMSASSRLDLYEKVIKPYNQNNPNDIIPVVSSHSAYAHEEKLESLVRRYDDEEDDFSAYRPSDFYKNYGFNPWNINVCDEDIHMIVETRGLLGLSFDERVLGASKRWKKRFDKKVTGIYLLANNIIGMAEACRAINKHKFSASAANYTYWDAITIGTDYNGVIDPVDLYPTAEQFDDFERHIGDALLEYYRIGELGIDASNIKTVVRKLCIDNAWNFVNKHF